MPFLAAWFFFPDHPDKNHIALFATLTFVAGLVLTGISVRLGRKYSAAEKTEEKPCQPVATDTVEIQYNAYSAFKSFVKLLVSFEKHYWRVWLPTIGIPLLIASPMIVSGLMYVYTGHNNPIFERMLNLYFSFLEPILTPVGQAITVSGSTMDALARNPVGLTSVAALILFCVFGLLKMASNPSGLLLDAKGLRLKSSNALQAAFGSRYVFLWSDIARVKLVKPKDCTMPEQWHVGFETASGKRQEFRLSYMQLSDDRQKFMHAIERFAPHVEQDPELVEIMMPEQTRSYTELWLTSLAAPPKRERLAPLTNGASLQNGRYVVHEQLGVGGQGVAYVAEDTTSRPASQAAANTLVLKEFIMPVYVDKTVRRKALERFENEAKMLKELDHPQIVKLQDFFIEDHRAYLVLEHIDGESLRTLIERQGRLSNEDAIRIALQMSAILEYLHGLTPPVVHRDFTPDNLILAKDGTLKLIDFNVAHQADSTKTGTVVGKHAYLPPEQFRGKPCPQSDLYALGGTLYFLLTGHDPEPLTSVHPMLAISDVSAKLDEIVASCTQLDAAKRPKSAQDLHKLLEGALEGVTISVAQNESEPCPIEKS